MISGRVEGGDGSLVCLFVFFLFFLFILNLMHSFSHCIYPVILISYFFIEYFTLCYYYSHLPYFNATLKIFLKL